MKMKQLSILKDTKKNIVNTDPRKLEAYIKMINSQQNQCTLL